MSDGGPRCVGALLAGGAGTRMGGAKGDALLGGMPLAVRARATLRTLSTLVVQAGGDPIAGVELEVLADRHPDAGPAAGIEAALARFQLPVAVLAVDLPFVPGELLEECIVRIERGAEVCAPHWRGRWHPLSAAYAPSVLPPITRRLDAGRRGLQGLLDDRGTALPEAVLLRLGDPDRLLFNVNTPADLEEAERLDSL